MNKSDLIVVGGGIVGLGIAYQFQQQQPHRHVTVLEKEADVAQHQTGRNSGVLHSGIYYRPGTYRAQLCRVGKAEMEAFCTREAIAYDQCGKVIVATAPGQIDSLHEILRRGEANGVDCRLIEKAELDDIEPHTAGVAAIHVPTAGIADYTGVTQRLAQLVQENGGSVVLGTTVKQIVEQHDGIVAVTDNGEYVGETLIACAGLFADRVARSQTGVTTELGIVPFRGEYFELLPEATFLCNGLIYPVPDTRFPFLGVHFTRMVSGGVECGPNAVLAFAREGYRKRDVNLRDLADALADPGFRNLALKHWRKGADEVWRSFNKRAFVKALQQLVPAIEAKHLVAAPAGVRAQAIWPSGDLLDDFAFEETRRAIHVINAASPAATSGLAVGRFFAEKMSQRLEELK